MDHQARHILKLAQSHDTLPTLDGLPSETEEGGPSALALVVSFCVGLLFAGVSYGFFSWAPVWCHILVLAAAFAVMLTYGRRFACCS